MIFLLMTNSLGFLFPLLGLRFDGLRSSRVGSASNEGQRVVVMGGESESSLGWLAG